MVKPSGQMAAAPDEGTQQRILDAAHAVFIRRGTDGARMQEIADEAGVNKALLHYYYRSKEQLSEAVFRRTAGVLFTDVLPIMASDLELEVKIDEFVAAYLALLARHPYLPGYILGELAHHPERLVSAFSELIKARVQKEVLPKLRAQIRQRTADGSIGAITAEQFLITCLAVCVFPFAARPLLTVVLDLDEKGFDRFVQQRKKELPDFLKRALKP